jgi:hypothetical protein
MPNPSNSHSDATTGAAELTDSERWARRRRRMTQIAVFGGSVLGVLAVATPAMAWPAMGC